MRFFIWCSLDCPRIFQLFSSSSNFYFYFSCRFIGRPRDALTAIDQAEFVLPRSQAEVPDCTLRYRESAPDLQACYSTLIGRAAVALREVARSDGALGADCQVRLDLLQRFTGALRLHQVPTQLYQA